VSYSPAGGPHAVIFDFDGVLADAEPLHFRSLAAALEAEGIRVTQEEYNARYIVFDDRKAVDAAFADAGRELGDEMRSEVIARKAELFESLLAEGVPLFPGVKEAVRSLGAAYPIGIASSALREEIETILASHGLVDAFVDIVGAADVTQTKPHPQPYWTALERINEARRPTRPIEPSECVVFEDTVGGITGAKAAGMFAVAVTNTYPADRLADADRILPTLEGMTPAVLEALVAEGKSE